MTRPTARPDSDLLVPVLAEVDDATGFCGKPWDPTGFLPWTLLAGPVGTGFFYVMNFHRLGRRSAVLVWTPVFLAMSLLFSWGAVRFDTELSLTTKLAVRAVSSLVAAIIVRIQERRFHVYLESGGDPEFAYKPGFVAVVMGVISDVALQNGLVELSGVRS